MKQPSQSRPASFVALAFTSWWAASVLMAAEPEVDSARMEQISTRMHEFVEDAQMSGAVTLVSWNDRVVYFEAVGQADIDSGRPMRRNTVFAIASMTKTITATATMMLQDEGKLSIDDSVSMYLPEFRNVVLEDGSHPGEVTIRHLLMHTGGLGGTQQNQGSLKETVEHLVRQPLLFEPGSRWKYSPGLTVCGRIIEVVSGSPYEQFLKERIFDPLGMVDTTFFPTQEQQRRLASIYEPGPEQRTLKASTHWLTKLSAERTPNPSGGLFSTAADLVRFYRMILNGGQLDGQRVVSEPAVRQMASIRTGNLTTSRPGAGWGLGWRVVRQPQGANRMLSPGSFGHGGAFGTQAWIDPERRIIYLLLIQRTKFRNNGGADVHGEFQNLAASAIRDGQPESAPQ